MGQHRRIFAAMTMLLCLGNWAAGEASALDRAGTTDQGRALWLAVAEKQTKTAGVFLRNIPGPLLVGVYLSTVQGSFHVELVDPAGKPILRRTVTQPGLSTFFVRGEPKAGPWKLTVRSQGGEAVVLAKLTAAQEIPRLTKEESAYLTLKEAWLAAPEF